MLAPPGMARIVSLEQVERWTIGGAVTVLLFTGVGDDEVGAAGVLGAVVEATAADDGTAAGVEAATDGVDSGALMTGSSCLAGPEEEHPAASKAAASATAMAARVTG